MSDSDKPARNYREWLRQKAWPFTKRERAREGADSIMPHLEEFLEQARLLGKRSEDGKVKEKKTDPDKPRH
jgi:hypothetical protein